jgi:hypothetical protein
MEGKFSMSSNDDSAARRGRRADQAEPDWRTANRSGNQYPGQQPRDNQAQQASYSGFTRQAYPQQQPYAPPRQEPALPPQVPQGYYPDPAPQPPQQNYYQEPPRSSYVDPASPYAPPPPYDAGQQQMPYGGASGELFGREPSAPQGYEQNPYGSGSNYAFDPAPPRAPMMPPREDPYAPRIPQENSAPRYYVPDEQPQRSAPPMAPQPPQERGYPQQPQPQLYSTPAYEQPPVAHESYQQRPAYDSAFPGGQGWNGGEPQFDEDEVRSGRPPIAAHNDDFDEEFPDEDFDGDDYGAPKKGSRKKLFAALLLSAAAVVVGGTYGYKMLAGPKGERATPLIQADRSPSKEAPENPGGKQFPHGEKAIYERLTPDGRTQVASSAPIAATVAPAFATPPSGGSSLEDRIDEALKKAQRGGDAAPADQPTVVRSENYRPDGTRVEPRPVITPSIVNVDNGLPYPFGNAAGAAPAAGQQAGAPMKGAPMNSPAQPQFQTGTAPAGKKMVAHTPPPPPVETSTAAAVPAPAGGFYVSLKSAPDEKAIQKDLTALTEKYKGVLGDVQLTTKIADLGSKGVTYRAVAGPVGSKQEAMDLCTKIKGVGGDKACFVTN